MPDKILFLKLSFTNLSYLEIIHLIQERVKNKKALKVTTVNLKMLIKAIFNKKLRDVINSFDIIVPVGVFLNAQIKKVYPDFRYQLEKGGDFITPFFHLYHENSSVNFMIFGGKQSNISKMRRNLNTSFPGIKLIGLYSDEFVSTRLDDVRAMVKKGDLGLIYLGLGRSRDEWWVHQNQDILTHNVTICVNNSVRIMTGEIKDVPYFYKENNKEFLYYLKGNPFRIFHFFVWTWIMWKTFFFKRKVKKMQKKGCDYQTNENNVEKI